eukprot:TRINITY_DN7517_c0_g1_i2.p2 TRINITY_DN7517_c0_g1~~TRINITY_DN7517_c0_g1_i2.p2  ORF type:complete len:104 (+),score=11.05 TRINITY_DN7517_c0_g1_i2:698-1009(+)
MTEPYGTDGDIQRNARIKHQKTTIEDSCRELSIFRAITDAKAPAIASRYFRKATGDITFIGVPDLNHTCKPRSIALTTPTKIPRATDRRTPAILLLRIQMGTK